MHDVHALIKRIYPVLIIALVAILGFIAIQATSPASLSLTSLTQDVGTIKDSLAESIAPSMESGSLADQDTRTQSGLAGQSSEVAAAAVSGCVVDATLEASAESIPSGAEVSYDLVVANSGTVTCQNVSYSMYYSENQLFSSAVPNPTSGNYYWKVGALAPSSSHAMRLTMKNPSGSGNADMVTEVCATADNGLDSCAAADVSVGSDTTVPAIKTTSVPQTLTQPIPESTVTGEYGVWVWESPVEMSSARSEEVISIAKANNFNVIYITIDDYLKIHVLPEGSDKTMKKEAYFLALSKIISSANAKGIAIDVEGGWRDWAVSTNRWKGYALIDFVKEYNARYPSAKIRGLQYDVEPYLLSTYENNKVGALKPFVEFIDESAKRMATVDAKFTVVIPHFYDSTQKWTPTIPFNGKKKHTFTHLLDSLERKPGSMIIIMSYRNFFAGANGTEQISKAEIVEASSGKYSTRIIVAQETGNVEPDYVTFYGLTKSDLLSNVNQIQAGFQSYSRFGGVAIHYLDPFTELR